MDGYLRKWQIIGRPASKDGKHPAVEPILPISGTTWERGVRSGLFPKPVKIGDVALWRRSDIDRALDELAAKQAAA